MKATTRSNGAGFKIANPETVYSLHIGINDYPSSPLKYCVNDVTAVTERLSSWGMLSQNMVIVPSKEATTANFKRALVELVERTPPYGFAFFQYSGHGSNLPCEVEADDGRMELMCPNDIQDDFENNNVSDDYFAGIIQGATSKNVTMFALIDCCNAGDMTRAMQREAGAPEVRTIQAPAEAVYRQKRYYRPKQQEAKHHSVVMLGGCQSDELSYEHGKAKKGALTFAFLQETAKAERLLLPAAKLHKAIAKRVSNLYPAQNPCLEGHPELLLQPLFTRL
jgi:hypothetical protein